MSMDLRFVRRIVWGVGKSEMASIFPGWENLPPHPTQNAIGFFGQLLGEPAAVVCYFRKAWLSDKLTRVNVTWWLERPPDVTIVATYEAAKQALTLEMGRDPEVMDVSGPAPDEFRQSEMIYWRDPSRVITLSCGLVQDGVPPSNPALGLGIMDSKHDPMARMFV